MTAYDLAGIWRCDIPGQSADMAIPGSLDENRIGFPDRGSNQWHPDINGKDGMFEEGAPIATRLTRRYAHEGPAVISRPLRWQPPEGKRVFLEVERARKLSLSVNGEEIAPFTPGTVSTPWVFEVTGLLTGDDKLALTTDNSYPGWPRDAIVYSSAATDETQTNWNGLLGYVRLRVEEPTFMESVRAYPHGNLLDVCVTISAPQAWQGRVTVSSGALAEEATAAITSAPGLTDHWLRGLKLRADAARWDEDEGRLHTLSVAADGLSGREIRFGARDFQAVDGRFRLNGRTIFLRSEANCAVFPETGYCPMTIEAWRGILQTYRGYGVNCMRFHSHCPPEAAFAAADELGMMMQPELSHWNPKDAFASPESQAFYRGELLAILRTLANHPSFVMLTLGNELWTDAAGRDFMTALLKEARACDPTRLYAEGSNNHYGQRGCDPASDFCASHNHYNDMIRATSANMEGYLNHAYPDGRRNFEEVMAKLRQRYDGPVFAHEVGQYEVLPDFDELADFHGVTAPVNYEIIRDRVAERGLLPVWKTYVEATGELSLRCYREEVEAALRTESLSGISLLGIQDFPGQGTALVGMLNAHLRPKPFDFARPERFQAFFRNVLPLALLPRYTYESTETLTADVRMANYGREALHGQPEWSLIGDGVALRGTLSEATVRAGGLTDLGRLSIPLRDVNAPAHLTLTLSLKGHSNAYDLWVYPPIQPVCPPEVYETARLDERAEQTLARGGIVYLTPPSTKEALPQSIQAQFSPDFWSVGTFAGQEGGMGQLIDAGHPLFHSFPTAAHTDWQWWPMAGQRALILPEPWQAIVTVMDSYATLRPMAQLLECRCGGGRLLLSTMGLQDLQQYPEARALLGSLYGYLASGQFQPTQEIPLEALRRLIP